MVADATVDSVSSLHPPCLQAMASNTTRCSNKYWFMLIIVASNSPSVRLRPDNPKAKYSRTELTSLATIWLVAVATPTNIIISCVRAACLLPTTNNVVFAF